MKIRKINTILFILYLLGTTFPNYGQTGPGGIEKNDGVSSLKLWLDAGRGVYKDTLTNFKASDGDRIRTWKDFSGNKLLAQSLTDKERPTWTKSTLLLNEKPAIRFHNNNGISDEFNSLFIDTFFVTSDLTLYCIFYPLSPGGGTNTSTNGGLDSDQWYYGAGILDCDVSGRTNDFGLSYTSTSVAAGNGNASTVSDNTIKTSAPINQSYIISLLKDGATGQLSIAANAGTPSLTISSIGPINAPTKYAIGSTLGHSPFNDNYINGYIAEIILYTKKTTLAENIILHNYLSAKYNIPISQNDFYVMDEVTNGDYDFEVAGIGKAADGSTHLDSKGEGCFRFYNPKNISNNQYLFWGHDNAPLNRTTIDMPGFLKERTQRIWRISETGGDIGTVDINLTLDGINSIERKHLFLLFDKNNNGIFVDETEESLLMVNASSSNNNFTFKDVDLFDGMRFTIALGNDFTNEKNLTITPNNDGRNDVFPITESGNVKIFDKDGRLIKELNCPCSWDCTKSNGELVGNGLYILKINDNEFYSVTVIR